MAKHRLTRVPKINYAHAALGVAIAATAFVSQPAQAATHTASVPESTVHESAVQKRVMPTAAQVLTLAKQQVGTKENAAGGGTKFQKWYMNSQRAQETVRRDGGSRRDYLNAAWCAMFVSWVGENTGARTTVGWDAYTVTHAKWFKSNKRWGAAAKPGSVVFFSWSGSKDLDSINHVGFVVKDNHDGTISTIEGNTGNGAVEQRVRPKSQVVGYGYPQYSA